MKHSLSRSDLVALHQVKAQLDSDLKTNFTLSQLAIKAGINEQKLKHGFRYLTGYSVHKYISQQRIACAQIYLLDGDHTNKEIAFLSGFSDVTGFNRAFKRITKKTPTTWKKDQLRNNRI